MDNREFLEQMGFFESDGWMCNPKLDGEKVFKLDCKLFGFEDKPLTWVVDVITATAINYGIRYAKEKERKLLANQLKALVGDLMEN